MGAPTSFTKWNPEDDLLLKNAVEAGASLESLAKGAVIFSRRFTFRELEDRWRSLLYDLKTSTEASTRIIEIENGVSAYNPSKVGRSCNSKAKETSYGRRKGESLQCHYHTARKKARNDELHQSAKVGFLMPQSSHDTIGNDGSSHNHFTLQNEFVLDKFSLGVPFADNYGHSEAGYYPKMVELESSTRTGNLAFHGRMVDSIETQLPAGISATDCLYGHVENIPSVPLDEAGFNVTDENFEPNLTQKEFSHAFDRNHYPPPTSNVLESSSTFHKLEYSPPDLPIWKTIEDVSTCTLQMDGHFDEKSQGVVAMKCIKKSDDQICDNATPKSRLNDGASAAALENSSISLEANFIDFSDSCMSFTDDEELLLIDVDEDDNEDKPLPHDLDSVLLTSSAAIHIDNLPISNELNSSETFDIPACADVKSFIEHETICGVIHIDNSGLHGSVVSGGVDIFSSSPGASPAAASVEMTMICVLNTEDQDVPCNDSLTLPAKLFQAFPSATLCQGISSSVALDAKGISDDSTFAKEGETIVQSSAPHSAANYRLENAPADKDLKCGASVASNNINDGSLILPPTITSHFSPDPSLKQEAMIESNFQAACMGSHPELVSSELGLVDPLPTMSISDQEDPLFEEEEDDDVPSFSDVEAMILDMDLGPYDQDSCLFAKEVSRYQCVDTKKTIIRLEQGARSYMNRAISSHGAFAIFYGRHLKYFIRTPEVLLGRETEEIKVDIDLGKEGRANKISRRQAIIKMDEDGYFHIKNIGKSSIFVNSKEVPAKKRINLSSCALIEIKDMRFIFEVNEAAVRRHLSSLRQSNHGPKSQFDFV